MTQKPDFYALFSMLASVFTFSHFTNFLDAVIRICGAIVGLYTVYRTIRKPKKKVETKEESDEQQ